MNTDDKILTEKLKCFKRRTYWLPAFLFLSQGFRGVFPYGLETRFFVCKDMTKKKNPHTSPPPSLHIGKDIASKGKSN